MPSKKIEKVIRIREEGMEKIVKAQEKLRALRQEASHLSSEFKKGNITSQQYADKKRNLTNQVIQVRTNIDRLKFSQSAYNKTARQALSGTNLLSKAYKKMSYNLSSIARIAAGVASGLGLAFGVKAITRQITSLAEYAAVQEREDQLLKNLIDTQGRFSDSFYENSKKMAEAFQIQTGIGDETIQELTRLSLVYQSVSEHDIPKMISTSLNLARAMGIDARTAIQLLGRAAEGQFSTLSRYGIILDKNIYATRGFAGILEEVSKRVEGSAKAYRKTYLGTLMAFRNEIGDLREIAGSQWAAIMTPVMDQWILDLQRLKKSGDLSIWIKDMSMAVLEGIRFMIKGFGTLGETVLYTGYAINAITQKYESRKLEKINAQLEASRENLIKLNRELTMPEKALGKLGFAGFSPEEREAKKTAYEETIHRLGSEREEILKNIRKTEEREEIILKAEYNAQNALDATIDSLSRMKVGWEENTESVKKYADQVNRPLSTQIKQKKYQNAWKYGAKSEFTENLEKLDPLARQYLMEAHKGYAYEFGPMAVPVLDKEKAKKDWIDMTDIWREENKKLLEIQKESAKAMSDTMGSLFYDVLISDMKSFEQYWNMFWQQIARYASQQMASSFTSGLTSLIGGLFGGGPPIATANQLAGMSSIDVSKATGSWYGFQHGGLVTKPTLAMLGEHYKPELVMPLQSSPSPEVSNFLNQGSKNVTINISCIDSKNLDEYLKANKGSVLNLVREDVEYDGPTFQMIKRGLS